MSREVLYDVQIGAECVSLRRKGESRVRVGTILGREVVAGQEVVYVDRLLLSPGDHSLNAEWSARGCVSTILSRRA